MIYMIVIMIQCENLKLVQLFQLYNLYESINSKSKFLYCIFKIHLKNKPKYCFSWLPGYRINATSFYLTMLTSIYSDFAIQHSLVIRS